MMHASRTALLPMGLLRTVLVLGAAAVAVLAPASAASAHPLGNFTVNHYTGLLVGTDQADIEHVVDLAEIPTAQLGNRIDDLDRLAGNQCADVTDSLQLAVAGDPVELQLAAASAVTSEGQAGLDVTRVTCELRGEYEPIGEGATVTLAEDFTGGQIGWREITARGDGTTLDAADVPTDSISDRLASYPTDLLDSPLDVRSATLTVSPGGPAGELEGAGAPSASSAGTPDGLGAADWMTEKVAALLDNGGAWWLVLIIALAAVAGAAHALLPGHGKTLMAFYLVDGQARSVRAALRVGLTVTAAHTTSVFVLGIVLAAGATVAPAPVFATLTAISGVIVCWLGVGLIRRARRVQAHDAEHAHTHAHSHSHLHGHDHGHPHGDGHSHGHAHGHSHGPGRGSLAALGIAGGVVPSPSALILLLVGVALGKTWLGALVVLAFGVGMAAMLTGVGLVAADVVARVQGWMPSRRTGWARLARLTVSYGGAAGVCAVGVGLVLRSALTI